MKTAVQVVSDTGVTYRQLDHWTRKGWVTAYGGIGSGYSRRYSNEAITQVVALKHASEIKSMSLPEIVRWLEEHEYRKS